MSSGLRTLLETTDFDVAVAALNGAYSPHRLHLAGHRGKFNARHVADGFDGMSVHILSYGTDVRAETLPFSNYLLLSQVRRGRYRIASSEGERVLSPGEIVTLDPYTAYSMDFLDDCEMMQMRIDQAAWNHALSELLGCDDPRHIRFAISEIPDPSYEGRCRALMSLVANEAIPHDWTGRSHLLRNQIIQLCVAALLDSPMRNQASLPVMQTMSGIVKGALDYFEANCQEDIGVVDVSGALRVSPRGLQSAFQRELGITPMAALREIRMKRAYADLKRMSARETTVTEVALQWGFTNLGRFAEEFRRTFDQHPNQVLRS